jgi:hypothetical protein
MLKNLRHQWLRPKTGLQLLILFALGFTISTIILITLSTSQVARFGEYFASVNENNIRQQAKVFLSRITHEQAMKYERAFQRLAESSSIIAAQTAVLLAHPHIYGKEPLNGGDNLTISPNGMFSNSASAPTMVLYWGGPQIDSETHHQLNTLSHLDPVLVGIKRNHPEAVAAYVVTETGLCRYSPNIHAVTRLPRSDKYEIRQSAWYNMARPENNPLLKTVWSNIYMDEAGNGFIVTAVSPILDETNSCSAWQESILL